MEAPGLACHARVLFRVGNVAVSAAPTIRRFIIPQKTRFDAAGAGPPKVSPAGSKPERKGSAHGQAGEDVVDCNQECRGPFGPIERVTWKVGMCY